MPKIQTIYDKKTKQLKYHLILPKTMMEDLVVQKGDELRIKSVVGNEVTFTLKRKSDIDLEKRKQLEAQIKNLE